MLSFVGGPSVELNMLEVLSILLANVKVMVSCDKNCFVALII